MTYLARRHVKTLLNRHLREESEQRGSRPRPRPQFVTPYGCGRFRGGLHEPRVSEARLHADRREHREHADAAAGRGGDVEVVEVEEHVRVVVLMTFRSSPTSTNSRSGQRPDLRGKKLGRRPATHGLEMDQLRPSTRSLYRQQEEPILDLRTRAGREYKAQLENVCGCAG